MESTVSSRAPPPDVVPGPWPNLPSWLTFWWFGRVLGRVSAMGR